MKYITVRPSRDLELGLAINIIEFSIFSQMARWSRAGFGANVEIAAASNELHDDETAAEGAR